MAPGDRLVLIDSRGKGDLDRSVDRHEFGQPGEALPSPLLSLWKSLCARHFSGPTTDLIIQKPELGGPGASFCLRKTIVKPTGTFEQAQALWKLLSATKQSGRPAC
jgi:hypothetical protein